METVSNSRKAKQKQKPANPEERENQISRVTALLDSDVQFSAIATTTTRKITGIQRNREAGPIQRETCQQRPSPRRAGWKPTESLEQLS